MIHWLERVPADSVFLKTSERVWTYRQMRDAIASRALQKVVTVQPHLDAEGVMSLLAGVVGGGTVVAGPHDDPGPVGDIDGAALVAYTSGSSGTPKGVRLTMGNLEAASRASAIHLGHDDRDTWLLAMPLNHVGGMSILVRSAYSGGAVRLESGFAPERFTAALHDDVTLASVVPTMLKRLLDHDAGPYRGLKAVLVGGGPIPEGLLERAVAAGLPVLPTYGMTETFGQVATLRPGSPIQRKADPLPGVKARIDDSGRIVLKSDQISPGYLGEPDRDNEWFVTSDIGEIDEDGAIRVLGRADTMILTGGENVDPRQVELELKRHPNVEHVIVMGLPDDEWGSIVVAFYVGSAERNQLRGWLRQRVPVHMIPKRWVSLDMIPTTDLGKPDRTALLGLLADGQG